MLPRSVVLRQRTVVRRLARWSAAGAGTLGVPRRGLSRGNVWGAILVVGAGRVGRAVTHLLSREPKYRVILADQDPAVAKRVAEEVPLRAAFLPTSTDDEAALTEAMSRAHAVLSCAPPGHNERYLRLASQANSHYVDVAEDAAALAAAHELAKLPSTKASFCLQAGVVPGLVSILASHLVSHFQKVETLSCRAGSLPDQPNNRLKYNITWATNELVDHYIQPCQFLRNGALVSAPSLTEREEVVVDGVWYEAFTTSGGLGTMLETYRDSIPNLQFKTLRYPGHLELMRFLIDDLKFRYHPEELVKLLARSIPSTMEAVVIANVRALGIDKHGDYAEKTFWRKVEGLTIGTARLSGLQLATAATACAVLDWMLEGGYKEGPFIRLETVPLRYVSGSVFGKYLARGTVL